MIKTQKYLLFSISFILPLMLPVQAFSSPEQDNLRYISDVLVINLKDRLERPYEVTATVQSNDQVRIIEDKDNYIKIETSEGKQGWIAKHYLKNEVPKTLQIKELKQENSKLRDQLAEKQSGLPLTPTLETSQGEHVCQNLQQKLVDAEKYIAQILEEQKTQQLGASHLSGTILEPRVDDKSFAKAQLEENPESLELLVSEFEKRGKLIADLQSTLAKKNDQTRFFWFGAGAVAFLLGVLVGKTRTRKKNKLIY